MPYRKVGGSSSFEAGADVNARSSKPLRAAAAHGFSAVARLLRAHGAPLGDLSEMLSGFSPEVQLALLEVGDVGGLSVADLARQGVVPDALCALLERQGQAESATMLSVSKMLEPLTPDERAELLEDLLLGLTHKDSPDVWQG